MQLLLCLLTLWVASGCVASEERTTAQDSIVAFTNVNVLPMDDERVLEYQTVVVRDGLVTEIGPLDDIEIPPGAQLIPANGLYLLPGLTDFHIHLRSPDELVSYLAHGVTSVVHMSGAMSGAADLLRYRRELAGGAMTGPTLYTTGPILDGSPPIFPGVSTVVTTPQQARQAVAEQHEAGYDFIKVYNNLAPDVLQAVVEEAHGRGMAVLGHIPRFTGRSQALQQALEAGQDMIAHGEEFFFTYFYAAVDSLLDRGEIPYVDDRLILEAARMTREAGTAVIPNLSFIAITRRLLDDPDAAMAGPEARYLHPDVRAMWSNENPTRRSDLERFDRRERAKYRFVQQMTKALSDAGVLLLLGTDASAPGLYPGASAHVELRELVGAGLTPYEALLTGTRNAGTFISRHVTGADPSGMVAPGHRADLLLVRGNPLSNIRRVTDIEGVMVRGLWLSKADLEKLREKVAATYGE